MSVSTSIPKFRCLHMYMEGRDHYQVSFSIVLHFVYFILSFFFFLRQSLNENGSHFIWDVGQSISSSDLSLQPCLTPSTPISTGIVDLCYAASFYVSAGDLNPSPHASVALEQLSRLSSP